MRDHPRLPAYSFLLPLAPWEPAAIVAEALASLRAQRWPAAELVVSCDGAPSPALRQVLEASALPVQWVIGPGGEGVGPVLARGLEHCRHELVLRADADDVSLPERSTEQLRRLLAQPELAALSGPLPEFEHDPSCPGSWRTVPQGINQVRVFSRWRNPLNHPAVALRRSRVLAAGNYRAVPGFEDYDLWLRLLASGEQLDNSSQPLVFARVGNAHLSRRKGWRYALAEARFLWRCGFERLLPWPQVLLLSALRLPLRLLPSALLLAVMGRLRRRAQPGPASTRGDVPAADG